MRDWRRMAPGTMLVVTHLSSDIPIGGAPMSVPGGPVDATVAPQPVREVAPPAWFTLMAPGWMPAAGGGVQGAGGWFNAGGRGGVGGAGGGEWGGFRGGAAARGGAA